MGFRTRLILAIAAVIIVAAIVIVYIRVNSGSAQAPGPVGTQVVEEEDCDEEDRAKRQWWECGPGVLDPKKTTKPVTPATTKPRVTRR